MPPRAHVPETSATGLYRQTKGFGENRDFSKKIYGTYSNLKITEQHEMMSGLNVYLLKVLGHDNYYSHLFFIVFPFSRGQKESLLGKSGNADDSRLIIMMEPSDNSF